MNRTTAVIIGAGQAGLAMSHCLGRQGIAHVVLERGRVAERWQSERWKSLRLLTPNWMTRLPGLVYAGAEPDGFLAMAEVAGFLVDYARISNAPVQTGTTVQRLQRLGGGYRVETDRGVWLAEVVVVATGYCDKPYVPPMAAALPSAVFQTTPTAYRNPASLPAGGILVVGASSSGVQLADELAESGRQVTLAVGQHIRLPRRYRGRDIMWWLDRTGILVKPAAKVADLEAARREPSLQLVGSPEGMSIDLESLNAKGVRLLGRHRRHPGEFRGRFGGHDRCRRAPAAASPGQARPDRPEPAALRADGARAEHPARRAGDDAGSRGRRHRQRRVGHGLPARLRLAPRAGARCGGRDRPRGRRHSGTRALRPRPQLHAPPQFQLHRRCR